MSYENYNIGTDIAKFLESCFREASRFRMWRRARNAQRNALAAQAEGMRIVERQMARGYAGDASEARAIEALSGRGGRENPLDQRRFRR